MTESKETKIGVKRMIEKDPTFWARNADWNEGMMKAEIKRQIIEREKMKVKND